MRRYKPVPATLSLNEANPKQGQTPYKPRHIPANHPVLNDWKSLNEFEQILWEQECRVLTQRGVMNSDKEAPEKR